LETADSTPRTLLGLDPLQWWLIAFVAVGLVAGIATGYFRARKIQPGSFKWSVFRREVVTAAINLAITTFVLSGATKLLTEAGWITFKSEPASWWIIALEYALFFFGFDTWFYWWHRLMHVEPVYKYSHKIHHLSISPNPVTSLSMNPIESIIEGAWMPLLTAVCTLHAETMILIVPTATLMGQYVHSGFEFLPRWWHRSWLTKWFITATFHDQHHRYFKGNYGGFTPIWDYLCGTVRPKYESDFEKITSRPIRRRTSIASEASA
jgi:Delta7-sterol 5-desaturase